MDIVIGGVGLRVLCSNSFHAGQLSEWFDAFLVSDPQPLAVALYQPDPNADFHVVIDRSGRVLGRFRSGFEAVIVAARYVSSLEPARTPTVRLCLRSVHHTEGAQGLLGEAPGSRQPLIERQLTLRDLFVVDSFAVDLDPRTHRSVDSPKSDVVPAVDLPGHRPAPRPDGAVTHLLLQAAENEVSDARLVHFLTSAVVAKRSRHEAMQTCDAIATSHLLIFNEEASFPYDFIE